MGGATACTDVTGFGLLGHLHEMLDASGVAAKVCLSSVPVLEGVRALVRDGVCPGGTRKNLAHYAPNIVGGERIDETEKLILADAQTSGGLLVSLPRDRVGRLKSLLLERNVTCAAEIGEVVPGPAGRIELVP